MVLNSKSGTFNRFISVSRETISSLKKYENILIKANKNLNLIGKSTINEIWTRHYLDSAQVIDFIGKSSKIVTDLGSGAGFPGLVLAILAKDRKMIFKIELLEKSPKKVKFLQGIIKELKLNAEAINENALEEKIKFRGDVITARAFKPLEIILEVIHKKHENWKKAFIFLGKTWQHDLLQASKIWDIEYKQRVSLTNADSVVIEINNLKKKIE